ncbi:hypothetical protein MA5S0921_5360 [Mycobacteroides abscessus 5S-0921]|nr:hypothetical protein MA5S0921_5360 [Mycobacteroides abscessus 5S-0921]
MLGVSLDGVDEIRDEIGSPSELDVDTAECLVDPNVLSTEPVESDNDETS